MNQEENIKSLHKESLQRSLKTFFEFSLMTSQGIRRPPSVRWPHGDQFLCYNRRQVPTACWRPSPTQPKCCWALYHCNKEGLEQLNDSRSSELSKANQASVLRADVTESGKEKTRHAAAWTTLWSQWRKESRFEYWYRSPQRHNELDQKTKGTERRMALRLRRHRFVLLRIPTKVIKMRFVLLSSLSAAIAQQHIG